VNSKKQCSQCGKKAEVFVTLVKTGHTSQSAYCWMHAEQLGLFSVGAYALLDAGSTPRTQTIDRVCCPTCAFTLRDWKRTGRFGCPECYTAFADKISPALDRLHADTVHRGKVPRRGLTPELIRNRMVDLQHRLDSAVREERFEDAAEARDEMSALESRQNSPGGDE